MRNILRKTKRLQKEMGNLCVKRVKLKAAIPSSIRKETFRRALQKVLKQTHVQRKGILTKTDLKLGLKFSRKVRHKRAMCNYEIWNHQKTYGTRESRS